MAHRSDFLHDYNLPGILIFRFLDDMDMENQGHPEWTRASLLGKLQHGGLENIESATDIEYTK